jgi:NAD(P)-dependent dehydrogenase (short-subunit alcohol dehydrogenase family)
MWKTLPYPEEVSVASVLAGRTALITGAAQGIGRGIALALAAEGAQVVLVDRDAALLDGAEAEVTARGADALGVRADVADADDVSRSVAEAVDRFGRVDVLVNNAQAMVSGVPFEDHDDASFDLAISTGLWGTFRYMRACFPSMREHGGSIVNVASSAGTHGLPGFAGYAAAKEGIRGLTKVAAHEWGQHGIRVNAICPQARTPKTDAYFERHPERQAEKIAQRPIQRDGDSEHDIGRTVVYLAGPDSAFVTGATLMVNGGLTVMP